MTDLETLFEDEETRNKVKALLEAETAGLKSKKDELLAKVVSSKAEKEELEKLRKAEEDRKLKADEEAQNYDEAKKKLEAKYTERVGLLENTVNQMKAEKRQTIISKAANSAIRGEKGVPELLEHVVVSKLAVDDDGNVFVKGRDGNPAYRPDGTAMTVKDIVADLKESNVYKMAFLGSQASGGGTAQPTKSSSAPTKSWAEMNLDERTALYKSDPDAYRKLSAEG